MEEWTSELEVLEAIFTPDEFQRPAFCELA
jgi:hypothetical protein